MTLTRSERILTKFAPIDRWVELILAVGKFNPNTTSDFTLMKEIVGTSIDHVYRVHIAENQFKPTAHIWLDATSGVTTNYKKYIIINTFETIGHDEESLDYLVTHWKDIEKTIAEMLKQETKRELELIETRCKNERYKKIIDEMIGE